MSEEIVIIDQVEDDQWDGKPYKKIITMAGETYKMGRHLTAKYDTLQHGVALRLMMDTHEGKLYVKDFETCLNLSQERIAQLSKPAPKNPKDLSIERQVAVKCVSEMLAAGIEVPEDIRNLTLEWLRGVLK